MSLVIMASNQKRMSGTGNNYFLGMNPFVEKKIVLLLILAFFLMISIIFETKRSKIGLRMFGARGAILNLNSPSQWRVEEG